MTENKRTTNKQIMDKLEKLGMSDIELNALAIKIVSRMVKLKSMEDWYHHVHNSEEASSVEHIEMTEEEDALGEAARLMTLMSLFQDKEEYEKCATIKRQMDKINKILKKGNK